MPGLLDTGDPVSYCSGVSQLLPWLIGKEVSPWSSKPTCARTAIRSIWSRGRRKPVLSAAMLSSGQGQSKQRLRSGSSPTSRLRPFRTVAGDCRAEDTEIGQTTAGAWLDRADSPATRRDTILVMRMNQLRRNTHPLEVHGFRETLTLQLPSQAVIFDRSTTTWAVLLAPSPARSRGNQPG